MGEAMNLEIRACDPDEPEISRLLEVLSTHLQQVTGRNGKNHFNADEVRSEGGCFLAAFQDGEAVACGGLRPAGQGEAEVKRFYVARQRCGIGTELMAALQDAAKKMGYHILIVETGKANVGAVAFYRKQGFTVIPNYGVYVGMDTSICFEREIV